MQAQLLSLQFSTFRFSSSFKSSSGKKQATKKALGPGCTNRWIVQTFIPTVFQKSVSSYHDCNDADPCPRTSTYYQKLLDISI